MCYPCRVWDGDHNEAELTARASRRFSRLLSAFGFEAVSASSRAALLGLKAGGALVHYSLIVVRAARLRCSSSCVITWRLNACNALLCSG